MDVSNFTCTDFRELFNVPHAVLAIFTSNRCNFECAHCCTESSSKEPRGLSPEDMKFLPAELKILPRIQALHLSGGEPFLEYPLLRSIAKSADESGKWLGINTNGFWIRSQKIKDSFSNELKGITHLFISYSKWHKEFISPWEIRQSLEFAISCGRSVDLILVCEYSLNEADVLTDEIFPDGIPANISTARGYVEPLGRAAGFVGLPVVLGKAYIRPADQPPQGCNLVNRPTILDDGSFLMCCNTVNFKLGAIGLKLGSIREKSLSELSDLHFSDVLVNAIRTIGPTRLLADSSRIANSHALYGKCSDCSRLLSNPKNYEALRNVLHSLTSTGYDK